MVTNIIHLSDFHIDDSDHEAKNLDIIVKNILEYDWAGTRPIILITGDMVNDGQKDQFKKVRAILDPLYRNSFTMLPVPGNHDYGWRGNHAEAKRFKHFKSAFYFKENISYPQVKEINNHTFIGLNSMKAETGFFDGLLADGELGRKQIDNLKGILKKCDSRPPGEKVIIFIHHHPFLYPDESGLKTLFEKAGHWLKDGEEFMELIKGRVDILLFGHEHRHLDFSQTDITRQYEIPLILSASQCTERACEYAVDQNGCADEKIILAKGLLGSFITISNNGDIQKNTIRFDKKNGLEFVSKYSEEPENI